MKISKTDLRRLIAEVCVEEMKLNELATIGGTQKLEKPEERAKKKLSAVAKAAAEAGDDSDAAKILGQDDWQRKLTDIEKKDDQDEGGVVSLEESTIRDLTLQTASEEGREITPEEVEDLVNQLIALGMSVEELGRIFAEFEQDSREEQELDAL